MATVSSTLKLFDAISGPLKQITNSMNITISVMNQMNSATTNNAQVSRQLTAAQRELASAEAALRTSAEQAANSQSRLNSSMSQGTSAQNRLNQAMHQNISTMGKFSTAIITINQGLELTKKLWNTVDRSMAFADSITSANARLKLVNDGLRTQLDLQQQVLKVANDTQTSYQATADTVSKIGLFTQGLFKNNNEMLDFTKSLNQALSIGGGDQVNKDAALLQLNQALASGRLQGDEFRSISENAPMFMDVLTRHLDISRGALRQLSSEGKLTSDVIVAAFKSQSDYISKTFNDMPLTFGGAMTIIKNKWVEFVGFLNSAGGPLTRLTDQLKIFIAWLETDRAEEFFNSLYVGINAAVSILIFFTNIVANVVSIFQDYWLPITTFVLIATIGFVITLITTLWGMIPVISQIVLGFLAIYWPVLAVAAVIAILIVILMKFGVTSEQIIGFVGALFYGLGATIWNIIANTWNLFATFAEFLINLFIDPTYAIKKLFYDLAMLVIDNMSAMAGSFDTAANVLANVFVSGANIAIGAINGLIKALNMIPGVDIGEVNKINPATVSGLSSAVKNFANNLEAPTSSKNVVSIPRATLKSIPDAITKGYSAGAKIANTDFSNMLKNSPINTTPESVASDFGKSGAGAGKTPDIGKVGKVGSVGKIDDTVDISSEDLKMMRELAEMKSIQNFVTLTPTLQVQTGDIRETADIQELIAKLEQMLAEQIAESAKGVYS